MGKGVFVGVLVGEGVSVGVLEGVGGLVGADVTVGALVGVPPHAASDRYTDKVMAMPSHVITRASLNDCIPRPLE